ncbi:hypothetical protein GQ42DRAFT_111613, partial [Ramicandelaber brevisporus]
VAIFLLKTDGLSKTAIGEYLGEGEPINISTMHSFVDLMDFTEMKFVKALRMFLQSFRLPGESQKIDRYMLKFAERYVLGNPSEFANADTAYTLAFSVIMLNTDLYNPHLKRRMTKPEFIRNNRGINDNASLPDEYLEEIYDEIANEEIRIHGEPTQQEKMKQNENNLTTEDEAAAARGAVQAALDVLIGRAGAQQAAMEEAARAMAHKSEQLLKLMHARQRRRLDALNTSDNNSPNSSTFYTASSSEHAKPMFENIWTAVLAGLSAPSQQMNYPEYIKLCLDGYKYAIHITCIFGLDLERKAFLSALAKFTTLTNVSEMKPKNVEAIKTLLDVAANDGDGLRDSWLDVMQCVSQLERLQLISATALTSSASNIASGANPNLASSAGNPNPNATTMSASSKLGMVNAAELARLDINSQQITLAVDKLFTSSEKLSGSAIVDFVRSLAIVSWSEISLSANITSPNDIPPRLYCLQKIVEVAYYNMNRIRVEWSNIWAILGEHFNQVGCQPSEQICFFALDSLRQLSMRFLEKEELLNFKFQKDFLRPFHFILENNDHVAVKDMVLRCIQQIVLGRGNQIRSGWRTILATLSAGAREVQHESIVAMSFDVLRDVARDHLSHIISVGAFPELVSCLTEFCTPALRQRIELQKQLEQDRTSSGVSAENESTANERVVSVDDVEAPTISPNEDPLYRHWFPVFHAMYDIIMQCDDLEVRTKALDYMFEFLKRHGKHFSFEFWGLLLNDIVFPIFRDLRPPHSLTETASSSAETATLGVEDIAFWFSTTLVKALRHLIDLFTIFYSTLSPYLDGILNLFVVCILQESETLAKIGTACFQEFVERNHSAFDIKAWRRVCLTFQLLFRSSVPHVLFEIGAEQSSSSLASNGSNGSNHQVPSDAQSVNLAPYQQAQPQHHPRSTFNDAQSVRSVDSLFVSDAYSRLALKCVLQLLLIQTVDELFHRNSHVYASLDSNNLFFLLDCLEQSHRFAVRFNADHALRRRLYESGFMSRPPSLLSIELRSMHAGLSILMRMYSDCHVEDRATCVVEIEDRLVPMCAEVLSKFANLDYATHPNHVEQWLPIVMGIL